MYKLSEVKHLIKESISLWYGDASEALEALREGDLVIESYEDSEDRAKSQMEQDLWAFNTDFLLGYIDAPIEKEALSKIQEQCEGANEVIRALIGDNLNDLLNDAIGCDGLGHFLNSYDGQLIEHKDLVAYRTN